MLSINFRKIFNPYLILFSFILFARKTNIAAKLQNETNEMHLREDSKSKCKICWCLDCIKTMKNTAEVCHAAGGTKPPKSTISNTKKQKGDRSLPKIN